MNKDELDLKLSELIDEYCMGWYNENPSRKPPIPEAIRKKIDDLIDELEKLNNQRNPQ